MEKKNILFVGEHPLGASGNSGMMASLIDQLDTEKFDAICFALEGKTAIDPVALVSQKTKIPVVPAEEPGSKLGVNKLFNLVQRMNFDTIIFVGIDIWVYSDYFQKLGEVRQRKGFKLAAIFPWDLQEVRKDWIDWINFFDFPCVYSMYGYNMLKDHVPQIRYFRPLLHMPEIWKPKTEEERLQIRHNLFPHLADDTIIFGSICANQHRKDPQGLIKGFSIAKKRLTKSLSLYLHTEIKQGIFNLAQYAHDCGVGKNELSAKPEQLSYPIEKMPHIYNVLDCLVLTSMQEGLSWTPLEAMLCGCPVLASDTTAQTEIVKDAGVLIKCKVPSYMPLKSAGGQTWIDSKKCDPSDIASAMVGFVVEEQRDKLREAGLEKANKWLAGANNINDLLEETAKRKPPKRIEKINKVLFIQHSSAGDVLMTTRCFKGLVERHGLGMDYMTSPQFTDIVKGNPYIDKVIPWDEGLKQHGRKIYSHVYNPHGERILPGCWGRNCNTILSDFYWKLLRVKPDDFFIEIKEPEMNEEIVQILHSEKPIAIVHTTGGDAEFRTYKYMSDVCQGLKDRYLTVQLGSGADFPGWADIDLRGKLSYRESAWVMDQAALCVSVDSFMSHLAGALGVSQVVLFGTGNALVVKPKQMAGKLVCLSPDYILSSCKGLGPCSAAIRDCPAPCTGMHDPKDILKAVKTIEEWEESHNE